MEGIESFSRREITKESIEPVAPEKGGTHIILQRHGEYERSTDSAQAGSLTEKGREDIQHFADAHFEQVIEGIPENERSNLRFLFISSDTQYEGGGRRSVETAEVLKNQLMKKIEDYGLSLDQILNNSEKISGGEGPRIDTRLREPQMFEESPDFVEFLEETYGKRDKSFWIAFEEDREKETREDMGAEGPDDIVDRTKKAIEVLSRFSRRYHGEGSEKRLIIWATSHYDTISPYTKSVLGVGKETPIGVDYGGGITIAIDSEGERTVRLDKKEYKV